MADLGKSKHTAQHSMPPSLCSNFSVVLCCLAPPPPPPPRPNTSPPDSLAFFGFGSPSSFVVATVCCWPSTAIAAAVVLVVVIRLSGWAPVSTAAAVPIDCVEPSPSDMARAYVVQASVVASAVDSGSSSVYAERCAARWFSVRDVREQRRMVVLRWRAVVVRSEMAVRAQGFGLWAFDGDSRVSYVQTGKTATERSHCVRSIVESKQIGKRRVCARRRTRTAVGKKKENTTAPQQ